MLNKVYGLAFFAVCCVSLPLDGPSKALGVADDIDMQALVAVGKAAGSPGKFQNFLPLVNQVIVYTGAVLPSVEAKKTQKKLNELSSGMLVQTMSDAARRPTIPDASIEKYLPTGEDVVTAMVAVGNVVSGSSGYNPMEMMSNLIGKKDMEAAVEEIMRFPIRFPEPDEKELIAAEQCILALGLGFSDQETAIDHFMQALSEEQKSMINHLQKNVITKFMDAMTTPNGDPTPGMVAEVKRQMDVMQTRTGSTERMPEELKDIVKQYERAPLVETAQQIPVVAQHVVEAPKSEISKDVQVLMQTGAPSSFKQFLPLVSQAIVYAGAVLPSIKAKKESKKMAELTSSMLVQELSCISHTNDPATIEIEKYLPTGDDILTAMVAMGNVVGGSSGFNPIQMMTNLLCKEEMSQAIEDIMKFPLEFPEPTDSELVAAEQCVLNIGLGFQSQDAAIDAFFNSLSDEKMKMLTHLQKEVIEKLMNSMMTPTGEPTPGLLAEIKRQMRLVNEKTGDTTLIPRELKDMVAKHDSHDIEKLAHTQALIAIQASDSPKQFKDFLPLLSQIVVYTGAVAPSVMASKQNKHNSELSMSLLVQTIEESGGVNSIEKGLPTGEDILAAMVAVGNVMGGSSGFNPVKMLSNLVGKSDVEGIIDEVMKFPLRFPDLTDKQLNTAQEVMLSAGLGFIDQEQAINRFRDSLSPEQQAMIASMEQNVFQKVMHAMMTESGDPSPALIEEIKSEMQEMEAKKGSTEMMPTELKDLVTKEASQSS